MRYFKCDGCGDGVVWFDQIFPDDCNGCWAWTCHGCGKIHSPVIRASSLETGEAEVLDPPLKRFAIREPRRTTRKAPSPPAPRTAASKTTINQAPNA
jgi:hypothetical protein